MRDGDELAVPIPLTPRLERYAEAWARAPRPPGIVTPGPGQESVWDYPRPPAVERIPVRVEVFVGKERVADSRAALRVLETASPPTVYLPQEDIRMDLLEREQATSMCEWKGAATYYAVAGHSQTAWAYLNPFEEYEVLAGMVSFYPGRVTRCVYGGEPVRPQPGTFYGGWVTPNLVGPFKGEPGSGGW